MIYIALQQIFTEVHVHPEEIYHHLRNQHIEIAPKLLMDVKRERKMKQMRDKLIAQSVSIDKSVICNHCLQADNSFVSI